MSDKVKAQFPSKCKVCGGAIAAGEYVAKVAIPGATIARYAHDACAEAVAAGQYVWRSETSSFVKTILQSKLDEQAAAAMTPVEAEIVETVEEAPATPVELKTVTPEDQPKPTPKRKSAATAAADVDAITAAVTEVLNSHTGAVGLQMAKAVEVAMAAQLEGITARTTTVVHKWNGPNGTTYEQPAKVIVHEALEEVRDIIAAGLNVLLVGPTQCGKSTLGKQTAESMGLPFYSVSCSVGMSEGALMGRLLPVGENGRFEFIETGFIKAWRDGGVFLLDEMDAMPADVAIVMNDALANGVLVLMAAPGQPRIPRHKDCVVLAAANTWGNGADRMYVGRQQLDFSTMQRFTGGEILLDYDARIEESILKEVNESMLLRLWRMRAAVRKVNKTMPGSLRREITTKHVSAAAALLLLGWTEKRVAEKLFCGWTAEEKARLEAAL